LKDDQFKIVLNMGIEVRKVKTK